MPRTASTWEVCPTWRAFFENRGAVQTLDMVATRYSLRPSEALPKGTIPERLKLWFDSNVAFKALAIQAEAEGEKKGADRGPVTSRGQALSLVKRAKAQVAEMERERDEKMAG